MSSGRSPVIHVATGGGTGAFSGAKTGVPQVTAPDPSSTDDYAVPMEVDNPVFDTTGYYNTGTVTCGGLDFAAGEAYTAPVSGWYRLDLMLAVSVRVTASTDDGYAVSGNAAWVRSTDSAGSYPGATIGAAAQNVLAPGDTLYEQTTAGISEVTWLDAGVSVAVTAHGGDQNDFMAVSGSFGIEFLSATPVPA